MYARWKVYPNDWRRHLAVGRSHQDWDRLRLRQLSVCSCSLGSRVRALRVVRFIFVTICATSRSESCSEFRAGLVHRQHAEQRRLTPQGHALMPRQTIGYHCTEAQRQIDEAR